MNMLQKITHYLRRLKNISFIFPLYLIYKIFFQYKYERKLLAFKSISTTTKNSILFFTTHKAASSGMLKILKYFALYSDYHHVNFDSYLSDLYSSGRSRMRTIETLNQEKIYQRIYKKNGFIYGPMREMRPIPDMEDYKVILMLRDPRDVLVSHYYSAAYSHTPRRGVMKERHFAKRLSLDEYAKRIAPHYKATYASYIPLLKFPEILYLRYSEMEENPDVFLNRIEDFVGYRFPGGIRHGLIQDELTHKNKKGNIYAHRRSGATGYFHKELSEETIAFLEHEFGEIINTFGFRTPYTKGDHPST